MTRIIELEGGCVCVLTFFPRSVLRCARTATAARSQACALSRDTWRLNHFEPLHPSTRNWCRDLSSTLKGTNPYLGLSSMG